MRSTLTTISVVALLATGASSAAARPADVPLRHSHATSHQPVAPTVGQQHRYLGSEATLVASPLDSTPAPAAHVATTRVANRGINWSDVGIGAGLAAAILLSVAGVWAARREPHHDDALTTR